MRLSKIKLINWMYFQNITLDIKGNTMLTGTNASGKSSIIDALQFVLVGNLKSVKFNTAADEITKRTLESYVRGFVNDDHVKYLRDGDVTSHISLEISHGNTSSLIGVVVDISSGYTKTRFYFVENCSITDDLYITEINNIKQVKTYTEFKKTINLSLGKNLEEFNSVSQYQQKQRSFFGILPDKYSKLLPKAIGFKSISKVESFVNDFLLDDEKINIEGLKNNITRLSSLQKAIEEEQEKLVKLEKISTEYENTIRHSEKIKLNSVLISKVKIEQLKSTLTSLEKDTKLFNSKNDDLEKKQTILKDDIKLSNDTITSIKVDINQNSSYQTIRTLNEDLSRIRIELEKAKENQFRLSDRLKLEKEIIKTIRNFDKQQFSKTFEYLEANNYNSSDLRAVLVDYEQQLKIYIKNSNDILVTLNKDKDEIVKTIIDTRNVVDNLKKNIKPYPHYVYSLINKVNSVLFEKYQRNIIIQPVCELSELINEDWRNAVEGYLNTQRFDLIIEPKYFNDALEVYENIKKQENIFGIGIVDCRKFENDINPLENTLSEYIVSENRYARNYLYSLLNKVYRVERVQDITNHNNSITKGCMTYRNNVARQIGNSVYQYPFIGTKANQLYLDKKQAELTELILRDEDFKAKISKLDSIIIKTEKSTVSSLIDRDNPLISSVDDLIQLRNRKNVLEDDLNRLGNDPSYIDLCDKLLSEEKKLYSLNQKQSEYDREIGANNQTLRMLISDHLKYKNNLVYLEGTYLDLIKTINNEVQVKDMYNQYISEKELNFELVIKKIENSNVQYNSLYHNSITILQQSMTEFNVLYNFSAEPTYDNIDKYKSFKQEIEFNNLTRYLKDLEDLKSKTNDIFEENFIQELRNMIRVAKSQIDHLNSILKTKHFGEHQYQLKFSRSKNSEFAEYYDVIMDEYNIDYDLFNDVLVNKNRAIIKKLFNKLTKIEDDKYAIDLQDYRKYIDVDIEIKTSTSKRLLSEVKHTQSGGESQVPYYIIAAASFQQTLIRNREKDSSLCIVLFDEAFNNMDSQRVSSMMKFYNELNIQIFLSLTGEKLYSIAKYVDSTLVIIRDGIAADVMPFEGDFNDQ